MHLRAVVVLVALAGACGSKPRPTMQSGDEFRDKGTLAVELERSPSAGAELTFCPRVPADSPVNLTNAAWLAFFSANEYAHLYYLAPSLEALGFDSPADFDWRQCIVDLRVLRGFEAEHAGPLKAARRRSPGALLDYLRPRAKTWGPCARTWFSGSGYDGERYPSPELERHLVQTAHPGHHLQFFSGGRFVAGGQAFEVGSTQVLFARHATEPVVIVSFRGTEPDQWSDLATDAKVWKTDAGAEGWGSVHSGFHAAYQSVKPLLAAKLGELDGTGAGVWITGHSLGGALATLLAADLLAQIEGGRSIAVRGLYTFGSPRVGDRAFAERFERAASAAGVRVARFRNGDDLVTAVPMIGYRHVGRLVHLGEGSIDLPDTDPEYAGVGSVADHSMSGWDLEGKPVTGYYRRLRAILESRRGGDLDRCDSTQTGVGDLSGSVGGRGIRRLR